MKLMKRILTFVGILVMCATAEDVFAATATYAVPVKRLELEAVAKLQIHDVRFEWREGNMRLEYEIPKELTGGKGKTMIFGNDGVPDLDHIKLSAEAADAVCDRNEDGTYDCHVEYVKPFLNLDPIAVGEYMEKRFAGDALLKERVEVSVGFANEPRGILESLVLIP